jgi:hypothetical protein
MYYSAEARIMRDAYEANLQAVEDLECENRDLEARMRDETGGCDCFSARIGCNGHEGRQLHAERGIDE